MLSYLTRRQVFKSGLAIAVTGCSRSPSLAKDADRSKRFFFRLNIETDKWEDTPFDDLRRGDVFDICDPGQPVRNRYVASSDPYPDEYHPEAGNHCINTVHIGIIEVH